MGSPPSAGWMHGLGSQGIYPPDSWQHSYRRHCSHAQRRGQKPLAPATSQGPPPAESVPCSCPFRGLAACGEVFRWGGRGVRTARPLQQAEMCVCLSPGGGPSCPRAERQAGGTSAHAMPDTPVARPCPWALRLPAPPDLCCPFSGLTGLSQGAGILCPLPPPACHEDLGRQVARSQPLLPRGTVQPAPTGRCRGRTVPHSPRTPGAGQRPSPKPGSRFWKTLLAKPLPWCAPRRAVSAAAGLLLPVAPQAWQALGGGGGWLL